MSRMDGKKTHTNTIVPSNLVTIEAMSSIQDVFVFHTKSFLYCLKKNPNEPRPSLSIPQSGGKMSKCLGGIIGCKFKTSSWHLNGFPDGSRLGSTV